MKIVTGYGAGESLAQAIVFAQAEAALSAGANQKSDNVNGRKMVSSSCHNYLVGYDILEKGESFEGIFTRIRSRASKEKVESAALKDGAHEMTAEGRGRTEREAVVEALGNLVIRSGSWVDVSQKFEHDDMQEDFCTFSARGYVGNFERTVKTVEDEDGKTVAAAVKAVVFQDERNSAGKWDGVKQGKASGKNSAEAFARAREDAFTKIGGEYTLLVKYDGGVVTNSVVEVTRNLTCRNCIVAEGAEPGEDMQVSAYLSPSGDKLVSDGEFRGFAWAKDAATAIEFARGEAILNAGGRVEVREKYDMGRLVSKTSTYGSEGLILATTPGDVKPVDGGVCADVGVKVAAVRQYRVGVENEATGSGTNVVEALIAVRRDLIRKSGLEVEVRASRNDAELTTAETKYRRQAYLAGYTVLNSATHGKRIRLTARGQIADEQPAALAAKDGKEVQGHGFGKTSLEAVLAAERDAVLSYRAQLQLSAKSVMGRYVEDKVTWSGNALRFDLVPVTVEKSQDGYYAVVKVKLADERPPKERNLRRTVTVTGMGTSSGKALDAAKEKAVDAVFGRRLTASRVEERGRLVLEQISGEGWDDGYVDDFEKMGEKELDDGIVTVQIQATVRQHSDDLPLWVVITLGALGVFGLFIVIGCIKRKLS